MDCLKNGICHKKCSCDCFLECPHHCKCLIKVDKNGNEVDCKCCNCIHNVNCEWIDGIHKDCKDWCLLNTHCELLKCKNFKLCNSKHPYWLLKYHKGYCLQCIKIFNF